MEMLQQVSTMVLSSVLGQGVTMEPKTFYCQIINFESINQALDEKSVIILKMLRECHQLLPVTVLRMAVICDILATFPECYLTHYQGPY